MPANESGPGLTPLFRDALTYAAELHNTQTRKGTAIPYVSHLMAVAGLVLEHGGTEEEAIAALLHDAIEDQGGDATRRQIRVRFGDTVTAIVDACTDAETIPKPPWRERKEAYIAHVREADRSSCLVSAADKLHNARAILLDYRDIGEELWSRFNGGRDGTLWYYRALVTAFHENAAHPPRLVDELDRVVGTLESIAAGML